MSFVTYQAWRHNQRYTATYHRVYGGLYLGDGMHQFLFRFSCMILHGLGDYTADLAFIHT